MGGPGEGGTASAAHGASLAPGLQRQLEFLREGKAGVSLGVGDHGQGISSVFQGFPTTHRPSHSLGLLWLPQETARALPLPRPCFFFPLLPDSSAPYLHLCLGPFSRRESKQPRPAPFRKLWPTGSWSEGVCPRAQSIRGRCQGPLTVCTQPSGPQL